MWAAQKQHRQLASSRARAVWTSVGDSPAAGWTPDHAGGARILHTQTASYARARAYARAKPSQNAMTHVDRASALRTCLKTSGTLGCILDTALDAT
jgi:hypothetical protein